MANAGAYPLGTPYLGSAPSPAYSGVFIPVIWSGKFVEKFYDATVLGAISSTDYEGEIRNFGDTVNIRTHPTINIQPYAANQALVVQRPSSPLVTLSINQGAYFNTVLDDVMEIQSDVDLLSNWADNASEQMKVYVDTNILTVDSIGNNVSASNMGTAAGRLSASINLGYSVNTLTAAATSGVPLFLGSVAGASGNTGVSIAFARKIVDFIIDCGLVLDEQRVPETGRWIVLPAWAAAMIKRGVFQQAYLTGDAVSIARNGRLGMIDRFTVYVSNLLPMGGAGNTRATGTAYPELASAANGGGLGVSSGTETAVYFGHSLGLTFASQMTKVETLRSESTFGTLMRGLMVWGFQVINPTLVGFAVVVNSGL
ncbi:MAG TPA: hypothetical protein VIJ38_02115 [Acidobacteriaceae bacterium]